MKLSRRTLLEIAGVEGPAALVGLPAKSRETVYVGTPGIGEEPARSSATL